MLIGEKKDGKTALASTLATALSEFQKSKHGRDDGLGGEFRLTQDVDFLRDSEGQPWIPFIFDDVDMKDWTAKLLKACLDMKAREAMSWARWGATKMKGQQNRFLCDKSWRTQSTTPSGHRSRATELGIRSG